MKLTKLSASAQEMAEGCLARWEAYSIAGWGAEEKNVYAKIGSAVHGALELYVQQCIIDGVYSPELDSLEIFLMHSFPKEFGHCDTDCNEYKQCLEMLRNWHARTSFEGRTVLSVESREKFMVPMPDGTEIPYNFVIDRLDYMGDGVYEVWDYKTLSMPLSPDGLHEKLQPRIYAMAIAIKFKDAEDPPKRIWVRFDMLRHDIAVGTVFSRDEFVSTWERIQSICARIIEQKPSGMYPNKDGEEEYYQVPETLNDGCNFCIRVSTCGAVQKNRNAGGIQTYTDVDEMINARALLDLQKKAAAAAVTQLDERIKSNMQFQSETTRKTAGNVTANIKTKFTRSVDAQELRLLVGDDTFLKYGDDSITMAAVDQMLKDPFIDQDVRARIESLITRTAGNLYVETKLGKVK